MTDSARPAARTIHAPDSTEALDHLLQRMLTSGNTPIAFYGASETLRRVCPGVRAAAINAGMPSSSGAPGVILGVIDDDPRIQGKLFHGLPVLELTQALSMGVRGVIITAENRGFEQIWAKRARMREQGVYLLTFPASIPSKGWDDCLIEQYEASLGRARGLNVAYTRSYPAEEPKAFEWLLNPLMERLTPGMTVCEIGSGAGLWTQHALERAGAYYAVDYSARLLHEVIEHRFARQMGKLRLVHDERASLAGVPDQSVDLLFSFDVFVHFKSDLVHQFLESAQRVLKPGGRALIHFVKWNQRACEIWREHHLRDCVGKHSVMYYNSMETLKVSADMLGLKLQQVGPDVTWAFLAEFRKE